MKLNKKVEYILKCVKKIGDTSFREKVTSIGKDGRLMYFSQYGDLYPDKRFYAIDFTDVKGLGMCAYIRFTLDKLIYADFHACIPVVFWGTKTYYSEKSDADHKLDAFWKYYQPINPEYTESVYRSFWVAKSTLGDHYYLPSKGSRATYASNADDISRYAAVFRKYFVESEDLNAYLRRSTFQFLDDDILGVHVRGTDYNKNFKGHPIVVTMKQYLNETKRLMDTGKYSKIFLATDDANAVKVFDKAFPNQVVYYSDTFRSENDQAVHGSHSTRDRHEFMLGLEVLRDMYTLASCSGLVASVSNVPTLARVIREAKNEEYRDCNILYMGENQTGPKFSDPRIKHNEEKRWK